MESTEEKLPARYKELFHDDKSKAAAFDEIALRYYTGNFGQMSKSDFETLLFHLYIEQILEKDQYDFRAYSDYRLSKELGITQSKVSNLKLKKHLQYPHEFKWRDSLAKISENVRYEDKKIKLQIPDINLYNEVKNAVEENGGFIDVSLTPKLLQVSPEYFLDLLEAISEDDDRETLRKKLRSELRENSDDLEFLESEPIGKQLGGLTKDVLLSLVTCSAETLIGSVISEGTSLAVIIKNVVKALKNS